MLGLFGNRINELEAENRRLRAELAAERRRTVGLTAQLDNLRTARERDAQTIARLSAPTRGRVADLPRVGVVGGSVLERICKN
jgi:hypothetical protein